MKKTKWSSLDHKIWRSRDHWPSPKRILVAFSGGKDSTALLSVLRRLSQAGGFDVLAAHIHHGSGKNEGWRDQAQSHCRVFCRDHDVELLEGLNSFKENLSKHPEGAADSGGIRPKPKPEAKPTDGLGLRSEAQLRAYRYQELRRLSQEQGCDWIVTAHHADDLLETRMLRLLRGTGPQGLKAMTEVEEGVWRPFLSVTRREIDQYVTENHLPFIEDPSNESLDPTRNWLRHEILPALEARQTGFVTNLGRSLHLLVEALQGGPLDLSIESAPEGGLQVCRWTFESLSGHDKGRALALILRRLGLENYSSGQIQEIRKQLDSERKVHMFTFAACLWTIDARRIKVSRNPNPNTESLRVNE